MVGAAGLSSPFYAEGSCRSLGVGWRFSSLFITSWIVSQHPPSMEACDEDSRAFFTSETLSGYYWSMVLVFLVVLVASMRVLKYK